MERRDWEVLVLERLPEAELREYLKSCEEELREVVFKLSNATGRQRALRKRERELQELRLKLLAALERR